MLCGFVFSNMAYDCFEIQHHNVIRSLRGNCCKNVQDFLLSGGMFVVGDTCRELPNVQVSTLRATASTVSKANNGNEHARWLSKEYD